MNLARTAIGRNGSETKISGYLLENAWYRSRERLVLQERSPTPPRSAE